MPVSLSQRTHFLLDPSALAAAPMAPSHERRGKVFNDPVHGHIYLSGTACDIIGALAPLPPRLALAPLVCALSFPPSEAPLPPATQTRPSSSACVI